MAAFAPHEEGRDRSFATDAFVTVLPDQLGLDDDVNWLRAHGYQVIELAAQDWSGEADLHRAVAVALQFPSYFGRNSAALMDCLRDVVDGYYGRNCHATGLCLVVRGWDGFATVAPDQASMLLRVLDSVSRKAVIVGVRLFTLIAAEHDGCPATAGAGRRRPTHRGPAAGDHLACRPRSAVEIPGVGLTELLAAIAPAVGQTGWRLVGVECAPRPGADQLEGRERVWTDELVALSQTSK